LHLCKQNEAGAALAVRGFGEVEFKKGLHLVPKDVKACLSLRETKKYVEDFANERTSRERGIKPYRKEEGKIGWEAAPGRWTPLKTKGSRG